MNKHIGLFLVLLSVCSVLQAGGTQESDEDGWRYYPRLEGFRGIDLRVDADLTLIPGDSWDVKTRGDSTDLDDLEMYVSRRVLVIRKVSIADIRRSRQRLEIVVTLPVLRKIVLASDGNVRTETPFESGNLEILVTGSGTVSAGAMADRLECVITGDGTIAFQGRANTLDFKATGSGDARIGIRVNLVNAVLTGSGDLDMSGKTDRLELKATGSGAVRAENLEARVVEVVLAGSSNADIHVTGEIQAHLSGSGSILYRGEPSILETNISGSGRVRSQ